MVLSLGYIFDLEASLSFSNKCRGRRNHFKIIHFIQDVLTILRFYTFSSLILVYGLPSQETVSFPDESDDHTNYSDTCVVPSAITLVRVYKGRERVRL